MLVMDRNLMLLVDLSSCRIFVYLFVCSDDNVKANGGPCIIQSQAFFFLFLKDEHYLHSIHEDHRPGVPWSP